MKTAIPEQIDLHPFGLNIIDDELGGVAAGELCLVSGGADTGRTPLALHFLYNGLQNEEYVALITSYKPVEILERSAHMGMPLDEYLRSGQLILLEQLTQNAAVIGNESDLERMIDALNQELLPWRPSRLIIDSGVPFIELFDPQFRQLALSRVLRHLRSNGMSVMLTTLMPVSSEALAIRRILEDMAGCSLHMHEQRRPDGTVQRRLAVRKMRDIKPPYPVYSFELSPDTGIHIFGRMDANPGTPIQPRKTDKTNTPPTPSSPRSGGFSFRDVHRKNNS